ncbi:uncharacterized protein LOC110671431 [Hevea brasiliensis]|uniref:uncharacterized protein LOC110671431 n=1 Tax=Hevea brasiliensis TaxID=3981 RepID=UPI0025DADB67|nr:uncharacterized protein LOC110671431 [Hevea brasiliensis]
MPRKKLILICQSGGEFVTRDDECLSYTGGEAHALDINHETMFDGIKLKMAKICNLEYKSVSVKYFLLGNRQALFTLANDKDLKRMYDFHGDLITADVFVLGREGFNHEDLPMHASRPYGTKLAETVLATMASQDAAGTPSVAPAGDATAYSSVILDMSATPADNVKKRRRTASWKVGAGGLAIVAVADNIEETRKIEVEQQLKLSDVPWQDISHYPSGGINSNDVSLEKMVASWKDGIIGVGQEFKNVVEFRDALQKYAIAHRFVYRLKKNDTSRASGVCVAEGCSWSIHASWVPSAGVFRIKKMNKAHACGGESWKAAHPAKSWLLNYTQVWRGIEEAREQLQGSYKKAYTQLPWFCHKMVEANPGSFVNLSIDGDSKFQRLFVSFHASIHATELDGDNGAFPVAFAIVDIENENDWHWFLEQLRFAISTLQSITFVSDKEKGLMESVLEIFENAYHGYSIYLLLDNLRRNLRGPFIGDGRAALPAIFLAAAHTIEPEYWTNALFKGKPYDQVTVNISESYTNWIEEVRELPMILKVEVLRCKMMESMHKREMDSNGWTTKLTPSKEKKLQEETLKARPFKLLFSSDTLFEVRDDSINVVDIVKRDCTCLEWKMTGLPCSHATAVFNRIGRSVYD